MPLSSPSIALCIPFYKHTPIRISYLHRLFSRRRSRFSHIQSMFDSFLGICWRLSIPAPWEGEVGILTLSQTTLCPGPDHLHCRFSAERCRLCSVGVSRRRGCLVGVIIFSPEDDISRSGASRADARTRPSGIQRLPPFASVSQVIERDESESGQYWYFQSGNRFGRRGEEEEEQKGRKAVCPTD